MTTEPHHGQEIPSQCRSRARKGYSNLKACCLTRPAVTWSAHTHTARAKQQAPCGAWARTQLGGGLGAAGERAGGRRTLVRREREGGENSAWRSPFILAGWSPHWLKTLVGGSRARIIRQHGRVNPRQRGVIRAFSRINRGRRGVIGRVRPVQTATACPTVTKSAHVWEDRAIRAAGAQALRPDARPYHEPCRPLELTMRCLVLRICCGRMSQAERCGLESCI